MLSTVPVLPKPQRAIAIDYFKSYLVVGMILAHTISLLYRGGNNVEAKLLHSLVTFINLISFSGFFFCFGYVNHKTYFNRNFNEVKKKMFYNALRVLLAYYISAFASATLLSNFKFDAGGSLQILTFSEMPAYSEFLISFFLITLISLLLFNYIKKALGKNRVLLTLIIISLLAGVMMPYRLITHNQLGLLIGTYRFSCFPVIPYLCFFITGVFFSKNEHQWSWKFLIWSGIISLPFVLVTFLTHHIPSRFPPGILWITGPVFPLYLYYICSHKSESWFGNKNPVLTIGHNTLFYLILSNIFLFGLAVKLKESSLPGLGLLLLVYLFIMFTIYYLSKQVAR